MSDYVRYRVLVDEMYLEDGAWHVHHRLDHPECGRTPDDHFGRLCCGVDAELDGIGFRDFFEKMVEDLDARALALAMSGQWPDPGFDIWVSYHAWVDPYYGEGDSDWHVALTPPPSAAGSQENEEAPCSPSCSSILCAEDCNWQSSGPTETSDS